MRVPGGRLPAPFGACAIGVAGWIATGPASTAGAIGMGYGRVVAWLIGLPRRAGRRLFAMNDTEARWRHWQVTELRGALARSYRDPRFDLLRAGPAPAPPAPAPPATAAPAREAQKPDQREPDQRDAPRAADPPGAAGHRSPGDWDDVHGWPWDGAE